MRMGDFGGVYLVTFIQILPPSAFFWELSKKWMLDVGWLDGWMLYGCCMDGYLKPVKPRAPCGANNITACNHYEENFNHITRTIDVTWDYKFIPRSHGIISSVRSSWFHWFQISIHPTSSQHPSNIQHQTSKIHNPSIHILLIAQKKAEGGKI